MFRVLYADPAWQYNVTSTGGSFDSAAVQKYDVMTLDEIKRIPVRSVMLPNFVLALWVTTPLKFSHGYPVMKAWGARYLTTIYWQKDYGGARMGMGANWRGEVEELLIGICGDVAPFRQQIPNHVRAPFEGHSVKPKIFREMLEQATGETSSRRNLELFAQRVAAGWTCVGRKIDGIDLRVRLAQLARECHDEREAAS